MKCPPSPPAVTTKADESAEIDRLTAEYVAKNGAVELDPIKEYTMEELQATLGYPISSRNRRKGQK